MSVAIPTFSQIRAQVAAIRKKVSDARVFGIHTTGRWTGERLKRDGSEIYFIEQCDSPLQMRIALQEHDPSVTTKILVTGLPEQQIGDDILVRLTKRRLFSIDSWQLVKSLFQARSIDPRVTRHNWIAEMLLDPIPDEGYPPAPGGFLDADSVWARLLSRQLGLTVAQPDLVSVLKWSMDSSQVERFRKLPDAFRKAAAEWIAQFAGPVGEIVLTCVATNEDPDALPVGLAAGVVFSNQGVGQLDKAAGRLEQYTGGVALNQESALRWHTAATEVVSLHLTDPKTKRSWLDRADEILKTIQADSFAYISRTSPLGFDQRLARYGRMLTAALDSDMVAIPTELDDSKQAILEHEQAKQESRRLERVQMSMRLIRWLTQQTKAGTTRSSSFAVAARRYASEGSFVDWARHLLWVGEPVRELSEAYARLWSKVSQIREQQSKEFAELLRDWTAAGSSDSEVLLIERVLTDTVAPLAAHSPVLVLVIDGMSCAVFREMLEGITRQDWVEIREEGRAKVRPVIAAVPSLTEVSRTSLFCGELRQGDSSNEAVGFAQHPGLLACCRGGNAPVLFHKVALQETDDPSLAANVRDEIASPRRRIVGVVINAVDDHLLKGDQLDIRWTHEQIKVLPPLLYEARAAGRMVVMFSDHGHVLDRQTEFRKFDGGDRWRADDGQPRTDEFQISGARVVIPANHRLIAPWSEKVRYAIKKNGYHGGLAPQEMVIPLVVLSAAEDPPAGWVEAPAESPDWWEETGIRSPAASMEVPSAKPQKSKQPNLFDLEQAKPQPIAAPSPPAIMAHPWLDSLIASPTLIDQKRLCGRTIPPDDVLRKILAHLAEQGGKMTAVALARKAEIPLFRLRGLLAIMQRLLNVEGYPVLAREEASDTIELNRDLLLRQFDL